MARHPIKATLLFILCLPLLSAPRLAAQAPDIREERAREQRAAQIARWEAERQHHLEIISELEEELSTADERMANSIEGFLRKRRLELERVEVALVRYRQVLEPRRLAREAEAAAATTANPEEAAQLQRKAALIGARADVAQSREYLVRVRQQAALAALPDESAIRALHLPRSPEALSLRELAIQREWLVRFADFETRMILLAERRLKELEGGADEAAARTQSTLESERETGLRELAGWWRASDAVSRPAGHWPYGRQLTTFDAADLERRLQLTAATYYAALPERCDDCRLAVDRQVEEIRARTSSCLADGRPPGECSYIRLQGWGIGPAPAYLRPATQAAPGFERSLSQTVSCELHQGPGSEPTQFIQFTDADGSLSLELELSADEWDAVEEKREATWELDEIGPGSELRILAGRYLRRCSDALVGGVWGRLERESWEAEAGRVRLRLGEARKPAPRAFPRTPASLELTDIVFVNSADGRGLLLPEVTLQSEIRGTLHEAHTRSQ